MTATPILHATTLARRTPKGWRGVMLQGPSGVGKSDLALRAFAAGWRLVADDRTMVWMSQGRVFARAPAILAGMIEVRHLGVLQVTTRAMVELALVVDCVATPGALERTPEPQLVRLLHETLPWVRLFAREASALAKVSLALDAAEGALKATHLSVSSQPMARLQAPRANP